MSCLNAARSFIKGGSMFVLRIPFTLLYYMKMCNYRGGKLCIVHKHIVDILFVES